MGQRIRGKPAGEEYGLTWWGWLEFAVLQLGMVAVGGGMLALLGGLALTDWPVGLLAMGPLVLLFALWIGYVWLNTQMMITPVIVGERAFYVRFLVWWVEVPWGSVTEMTYARWVPWAPHIVHVTQKMPFGSLQGIVLLRWGTQPVWLALGLRCRKRLFWEIWRRASRVQGWEVPVEGAKPPGQRRMVVSGARQRMLAVQRVVVGLVVCSMVAIVGGFIAAWSAWHLEGVAGQVLNWVPMVAFGVAAAGVLSVAVLRARLRVGE